MSKDTFGLLRKLLMVLALVSVVISFAVTALAQSGRQCPGNVSGYTVSGIKVHTSFGFSRGVKEQIDQVVSSATPRLVVNSPFSSPAQSATITRLKSMMVARRSKISVSGPFVMPNLVFSEVKNCDNQKNTLEVHFYVYTANYLDYLADIFDDSQNVTRAAPSAPLTRFIGAINPQPLVGFNRSRAVYGGLALSMSLDTAVVKEVELEGTGSGSSATAAAVFRGSRDFENQLASHIEWMAGYKYDRVPSTTNDLKSGTGYGQFLGATQPIGKLKLVARYGAAVETGNKQTDLDPALAPPNALTSSRNTSVKLFAGVVAQTDRQAFDASYGFEVGNAEGGIGADYFRNIFDAGYSWRFFPFKRRPFSIDTRFTTGDLNSHGSVPVAARFFGGNAKQNFISSGDWMIASQPFIRSFPQNRFLPESQVVAIGGDRFASFNLTAAATIWGKALVPKKITDSRGFDNAVAFQLSISEGVLHDQYLYEEGKPLQSFADDTLKLFPKIKALQEFLKGLEGTLPAGSDAQDIYEEAVDETCNSLYSLNEIAIGAGHQSIAKDICEIVVVGDGRSLTWLNALLLSHKHPKMDVTVKSDLYYLNCSLIKLADALKTTGASPETIARVESTIAEIEAVRRTACKYACLKDGDLTAARNEVNIDLASCQADSAVGTGPLCASPCTAYVSAADETEMNPVRANAQRKAKEIIDYSGHIIKRLTKEENILAVAPVFIFDAARIAARPETLGNAPTRYGIGAGGQLTFFNIEATAGYSFNRSRRTTEPRGAFVFSIKIADLLR